MTGHLTKRYVDALEAPPPGQRLRVFDDRVVGFFVVVQPTGRKSFGIQYGPAERRQRFTLGHYGQLTVEQARALAQKKLAEVAEGGNPLEDKQERRAMPTFGAWRDTYIERIRRTKKQARHDERYLAAAPAEQKTSRGKNRKRAEGEDHIRATAADWRTRPLDKLTRSDVQAGMAAVATHGHTTANRWLASVRACLQAAKEDQIIADNPAWGIKPFRENPPRARVLTNDEFERVVAGFEAIPDPFTRAAFVVLLDTGARKSEVLHARWEDFDLEAGYWRVPSPKAGHPQVIPLAEATVAYVRATARLGPWFVPGRDPSKPRTDLRYTWDHLREDCGIADVTIHDLRRTFGLHIARKAGLHVASKLLRHSDVRVTEKVYAPLGIEDLRAVASAQLRRE